MPETDRIVFPDDLYECFTSGSLYPYLPQDFRLDDVVIKPEILPALLDAGEWPEHLQELRADGSVAEQMQSVHATAVRMRRILQWDAAVGGYRYVLTEASRAALELQKRTAEEFARRHPLRAKTIADLRLPYIPGLRLATDEARRGIEVHGDPGPAMTSTDLRPDFKGAVDDILDDKHLELSMGCQASYPSPPPATSCEHLQGREPVGDALPHTVFSVSRDRKPLEDPDA